MTDYKQFFKGKKITVMGLGLLGRGLGYTKFLAECGADLIVTDLKTSEQLSVSLKALKKFNNIKYVLGEHRLEDFKSRDMIIKSAGVPLDSIYIAEAKKNNIPIEMDVSLFAKLAPEIKVVGVTGTRGKSMTTMLIYEILSNSLKDKQIFLGGNIRGVSTLPFLKKAKPGDILVAELDSWQLQGFGPSTLKFRRASDSGFSPHIAVFTSFMSDHMNYYRRDPSTSVRAGMKQYFADKANIFKYQKKDNVLVIRPGVKDLIPKNITSRLIVADSKKVEKYSFSVPGIFQQENLACAVEVARLFEIPLSKIEKSVKNFKGVEGRLQYLKSTKGVRIYNDNNATTPEATMAGVEALSIGSKNSKFKPKIVLISGGADKKLDLTDYVNVVNKYCKALVLIPGSGTDVLLQKYKIEIPNEVGKDLKDVVKKALKHAIKGDIILFSPAFASFGLFANEYERNDLFVKIVKGLK